MKTTMRKTTILLSIIFLLIFASCKKEYCVSCRETTTGVVGTFCGPEDEADEYIRAIKTTGSSLGQYWSCSKNESD